MISTILLPKSLATVFIIFTIFTVGLTENIQFADAVADVTGVASITGPNEITVVFTPGTAGSNLVAAPITAYAAGDLALSAGGSRDITGITTDSLVATNTIVYTFSGAAAAGDVTATLSITGTATDIVDNEGNTSNGLAISASDAQIPTFVSAQTLSATLLELTFSEPVTTTGVNNNDFAIGGVASSPSVSGIAGSGSAILTLTINNAIVSTDSPTFVYTQTGNALEDVAGNDLATTTGDSITNNVAAPAVTEKKGGGSGCSGDCENPTLGMTDHGRRLVDNGFSYNDNPIDVEHYFTPYPLVTAKVGVPNLAEFKIYDNSGPDKIHHFEFAFGLGKGESIDKNQAMIIWDKTFDGIETIELDDSQNVLENVRIFTSEVLCQEDSQQMCLLVKVSHTFRAPLEFNVLGTNVWDAKRNAMQNYYNHGVQVEGDSMNAPLTKDIPGTYKHEGIITVTQSELYSDLWIATDGRIFEIWENGSYKLVHTEAEIHKDTGNMRDRSHSSFNDWKESQAELATSIFDSTTLVSTIPESFAYDFPNVDSRTQFLIESGLIDYIRK